MESAIAKALNLAHAPVAVIWTDEKPDGALQFTPGRWWCVMAAFAAAAANGRTAAFDNETYGCPGGGVGLGFGNCYHAFMGGEEGFCGFLSSGNENRDGLEDVCKLAVQYLKGSQLQHFQHGERYRKSPADVHRFIKALPITEVPTRYVLFKPLQDVQKNDRVLGIVFLGNPDQISALTVLANYETDDNESVIMPHAAGCQSIGIYLYREAERENQRAILGLNDLSARKTVRRLGKDMMTFAVPMKLYARMEANLPGSFVECDSWKGLQ